MRVKKWIKNKFYRKRNERRGRRRNKSKPMYICKYFCKSRSKWIEDGTNLKEEEMEERKEKNYDYNKE